MREFLTALLNDVGTGLGIALYEEAVTHCFGGPTNVETDVVVNIGGHQPGHQRVRLIAPGVAFKITGFDTPQEAFEVHARRLLGHMDLRAIAWINISMKQVSFRTLEREDIKGKKI